MKLRQLYYRFFPEKFAYALVDEEGKCWSAPRQLTPERAAELNGRIRARVWGESDLRWMQVERKKEP